MSSCASRRGSTLQWITRIDVAEPTRLYAPILSRRGNSRVFHGFRISEARDGFQWIQIGPTGELAADRFARHSVAVSIEPIEATFL